jgi:hypothetical protein
MYKTGKLKGEHDEVALEIHVMYSEEHRMVVGKR